MLKAYETSGSVLFEEQQKYPRWIQWIVTCAMIIAIIGVTVSTLIEKRKTEDVVVAIIIIPVIIFGLYLSSKIQLEKVVTSNGLYYKWEPWHKRFRVIEKEDIEFVENKKFPFLSYGFGWFPGYGRYNNAGNGEGLQLHLKNGKKFYFSTADIASFKKAMDHLINPITKSRFSEF